MGLKQNNYKKQQVSVACGANMSLCCCFACRSMAAKFIKFYCFDSKLRWRFRIFEETLPEIRLMSYNTFVPFFSFSDFILSY